MAYLLRRLASGIGLLLALTFITYAVFFLIPTNPACLAVDCGPHNNTTPAQLRAAEQRLGLDRPVIDQYGRFLWRLVRHGSFGDSYAGKPIGPIVRRGLPVTASLVAGGALLLVLLALPLGAIAAVRPHGPLDRGVFAFSLLGVAMHPFVLAILLRKLLVGELHFPSGFYCSPLAHNAFCHGPLDWARGLFLPWLVFALFFLPLYTRMFRAQLLQTLGERYIQVARAKGASQLRILRVHALRNALLPILPMLAADVGTALTTAIYVEAIFNLNGLGTTAVNALSGQQGGYDLPTIAAIVFVIACAVVILNLTADIALLWLDPRITGRAGRHSTWRSPDGGLNRRRILAASAAAAAAVAGSAYAAINHTRSDHPAGPAGIARYSRDAKQLGPGWSERLTAAHSWTPVRQMTEKGAIKVTIHRILAGPDGWAITAAIINETKTPLSLGKGAAMGDGVADSTFAGFSIQYRTPRNQPGIHFGMITARPAAAYKPDLPKALLPGQGWSGTFAGAGTLPARIDIHVGIGVFRGPADASGYTLVTNQAFTRP